MKESGVKSKVGKEGKNGRVVGRQREVRDRKEISEAILSTCLRTFLLNEHSHIHMI